MNAPMKVLMAFDESDCASAAIQELPYAGLPETGEMMIVSVFDTIFAPSQEFEIAEKNVLSHRVMATIELLKEQFSEDFEASQIRVAEAARRVKAFLPEWDVKGEILTGNPAQELLRKANKWKPDLIVAGSHNRSAIGRFFLGSVSAELASKAPCSVRIVRNEEERDDARIMIVINSLTMADQIIQAVSNRHWRTGTQVRLVSVDDGVSPYRISAFLPGNEAMLGWAVEELQAAGLIASIKITKGNPQFVLLEEAQDWHATSVFVGAYGSNRTKTDIIPDEAAMNLVTNAECSVEIVRTKPPLY